MTIRRLFSAALPLLALTLLAGCASTTTTSTPPATAEGGHEWDRPLAVDPEVLTGTLDNGLRYVIRRNTKPEARAELRLALDVGSILETDQEQGLAHFVEHMAFNGTRNFAKQELWDYLERVGLRVGADLNAHTSFDETVYKLTVPTDSTEVVETAFQVFEDWAHGVAFDAEEIDKERGVVIEEWRLGQGADMRMLRQQLPMLFAGSTYAERMPIGQKAVLDTFDHQTLRGFYERWYRPDLMGFVAVGDFEPAYIESLVVEYLGRVPAPPSPTVRPEAPVPGHDETLFAIATDPEATRNTVFVYHKQDVFEPTTARGYRRSLLQGLYHGMLNRRLYELTTQPEPPFLGAYSGIGLAVRTKEFLVLGAAVENNGFERGLEALLVEAERVGRHGFTATELARQKKQTLRGMEQAWRERDKLRSGGFASEYVRHLLEDEPIPGIQREYELHRELLPTITLDEINQLASSWAGEADRVVTVNAPEKEGVGVPTEADLRATFERALATPVEPYVDEGADVPLLPDEPAAGRVTARDSIPELGVAEWRLSNGVRVVLKATDFKNDEIRLSAWSPGGHSLVADSNYVASTTATSAVTQGGLGNFDQVGLSKWLAGRVVSVRPYIGALEEGLSGSASPQDAETMFQMVHGYFTAVRRDSAAFAGWTARVAASLQNRSSQPEAAYADTIQVTMAQHHVRARPWTPDMVQELDLDRSLAIYRERFADASDFTFFLVGNLDTTVIEPLVTRYLASLPSLDRDESWRDVGIRPPSGVVEKRVRRGIEPKASTRIIFHGPFDFHNRADRMHLDLMADAFQIKLREVLREDLGGTYGVGVGAGSSPDPEGNYRLTVSFGCDPERVEELTEAVFVQIDSLQRVGLDSTYTQKVRQMRRRSREVNLKENGWWIGVLEWVDRHGIDPLLILDTSIVEEFAPEDVIRAAAWFDTSRYARFVLLPEEGSLEEGAADGGD